MESRDGALMRQRPPPYRAGSFRYGLLRFCALGSALSMDNGSWIVGCVLWSSVSATSCASSSTMTKFKAVCSGGFMSAMLSRMSVSLSVLIQYIVFLRVGYVMHRVSYVAG